MREDALRINHLVFGLITGAVASYIFLSSSYINGESAFMLAMFNFLFVAVTFPLNGKLTKKMCMMLMGNIIGLLWNSLFSLLATTITGYLGSFFNIVYIILNPFVNLIWILSFWSISLTVLQAPKTSQS